jgi:hypothetical protein
MRVSPPASRLIKLPSRVLVQRGRPLLVGLHVLLWCAAASAAPPAASVGRMFRHGLLWTVVVLIILAAALIALRRFSYRYNQFLRTKRRRSEVSDAWAQHRLPEDWDEQGPARPDDGTESDGFADGGGDGNGDGD